MTPLRALILEDSADDAALLLRELKRGGFDTKHIQVETAEAMSEALSTHTWDIIFSDFSMPNFNAFDALTLLHNSKLDLPFIIVSGTIGEDRAVTAMKSGAHDYILKGNLKRLVSVVERELREADSRHQRRQAEETIQRLAYIDPITGLPNRIRFCELVQQVISAEQHQEHSAALLLMDMDHFKEVNDTLGHYHGDNLLRQIGLRLRSLLFEHDVIARLGGDEFAILLPQLATTQDIPDVIKKIHSCLTIPFIIAGIPIAIEASIGVAMMPEHGDNTNTLMQHAEIAMYHAKKMASNYAIYSPALNPHSSERLGLMAELRDAIEQNQLLLNFQPKLSLKTGHIVGSEALVRWRHPRLGMVPPDKFILTAEQTGLISPLTHWVLIDALTHWQHARSTGIALRVSVNLSARLLHDPYLPDMIAGALQATGSQPHQLMLEITESAIVLDPKRAEDNLIALSNMGVLLSIDDFGTGYTSLASIKRLPINEIKIDKSFVTNMLTNPKDAMIVRTVIEFGHNFGLTVVAEGVETQEVLDALTTMGCDEVQGYFISKPQVYEPLIIWFSTCPYKI